MDIKEKITRALKDFPWWDYGMDDITNAIYEDLKGQEWLDDLAEDIIKSLQEYLRIP